MLRTGVRTRQIGGPVLLATIAVLAATTTSGCSASSTPSGHDVLTAALSGLVATPCRVTGRDGWASSIDMVEVAGPLNKTFPVPGRWSGHLVHSASGVTYSESVVENGHGLYVRPETGPDLNTGDRWVAFASTSNQSTWDRAFSTYSHTPGVGWQDVTYLAQQGASDYAYTCVSLVGDLVIGAAESTGNQSTITVHANLGPSSSGAGSSATVTVTTGSHPRVTAISDPAAGVALTLTYPSAPPSFAAPPTTDTLTVQQAAALGR